MARALDVANVDAVFLPLLEVLPLLGHPRRALARLADARSRARSRSARSSRSRRTSSMLVWPMRVIGQRVGTLQQAVGRGARASSRCCAREPAVVERAGARFATELRGARAPRATCASATSRTARARRAHARDRAGDVAGTRRRDGLGQEHRRGAARALLRRRARAACRSTASTCAICASTDVRRAVATRLLGDVPLHRHRAREHRVRASRCDATTRSSARPRLAGAHEFVARLPDGYDTRARRARLLALGRAAAAARDRARDPRRSRGADPRRRDVGGRRDEGARDPRRRSPR